MNNKTILITGGTGSFGTAFCNLILSKYNPKKLIIFSRDELKQYHLSLQKNFIQHKKKIRFFIGDVRDKDRLFTALNSVNIVIHAAALKQVNTAEYNPFETIKTNVHGAENIIQASLANNVEKVIALSTDKASSPINLYGASKLLSDKLFISSNTFKGNKKTIFSVVRYGNVFGSRGSVVRLFLEQRKKNLFSVTNKDMTRFSISLDEAVCFVERCIKIMKGGEIFVPKIPSYKLMDLVKAFSANPKIKLVGLRPGEKLHEEMISVYDSSNTVESKDYFAIYSSIDNNLKKRNMTFCEKGFTYSSEDNSKFLTISEIKKLIAHL
jgi:UDP-N-acetylglucosamine 4,6-dehydratase (inverting)